VTHLKLLLLAKMQIIFHEATMENSLESKAIEYGHSTPAMAAKFAMKVKGHKICLTHLSPRYKPIPKVKKPDGDTNDTAEILLLEAKHYLSENNAEHIKVVVAEDFMEDNVELK